MHVATRRVAWTIAPAENELFGYHGAMNYCSHCGHPIRVAIPEGDNRQRHVCDHCDTVHYQNPRIITGCIVEWQRQILLCRRAIEPRHGLWTLPAGFMENGESAQQGAMRETLEETGAQVAIDDLFITINLAHANQLYLLFRGRLLAPQFGPTSESLEVALFGQQHIPWERMAFSTMTVALRNYFDDRAAGRFVHRVADIERVGKARQDYRVHYLSQG